MAALWIALPQGFCNLPFISSQLKIISQINPELLAMEQPICLFWTQSSVGKKSMRQPLLLVKSPIPLKAKAPCWRKKVMIISLERILKPSCLNSPALSNKVLIACLSLFFFDRLLSNRTICLKWNCFELLNLAFR